MLYCVCAVSIVSAVSFQTTTTTTSNKFVFKCKAFIFNSSGLEDDYTSSNKSRNSVKLLDLFTSLLHSTLGFTSATTRPIIALECVAAREKNLELDVMSLYQVSGYLK
jgi:hypothetical protein